MACVVALFADFVEECHTTARLEQPQRPPSQTLKGQ